MTGREMQISTFSEDILGLQAFAEKLERFINVEHRYPRNCFHIGGRSKAIGVFCEGRFRGRFEQIYAKIEQISSWD